MENEKKKYNTIWIPYYYVRLFMGDLSPFYREEIIFIFLEWRKIMIYIFLYTLENCYFVLVYILQLLFLLYFFFDFLIFFFFLLVNKLRTNYLIIIYFFQFVSISVLSSIAVVVWDYYYSTNNDHFR